MKYSHKLSQDDIEIIKSLIPNTPTQLIAERFSIDRTMVLRYRKKFNIHVEPLKKLSRFREKPLREIKVVHSQKKTYRDFIYEEENRKVKKKEQCAHPQEQRLWTAKCQCCGMILESDSKNNHVYEY